ncbi:manganese and iron superoxide dismutase [Wallemia mellicola]|uniref:Superoxide dismutase n=1 Tax=Wallemia mellicola TaxID=1708541 RepID=A0A4T0SLP0_9BASI|nr:manganese and iron superoxide dismutase [Wallemia mellicola]TIC52979.1 manganese and iron superoxide dismutase [Wallemia mellicola]
MAHELPQLPYAYNALEPFICEEITIHHTKHHQTYVNALNAAEKSFAEAQSAKDVKSQIALQAALKFNGGGHINHSLFWKNLAPAQSAEAKYPEGSAFAKAVERDLGGYENLKKEVTAATLGIQGSGWGWLALNSKNKRLEVITTANQDPVTPPHVPLFGIDIWEHAFYLQYKNVKPDYLNAIFNVINWAETAKRYDDATNSLSNAKL